MSHVSYLLPPFPVFLNEDAGLLHTKRRSRAIRDLHFVTMTFSGMPIKIVTSATANGLPIAERKSKVWIHPLITGN
jgi:hypothetical protein